MGETVAFNIWWQRFYTEKLQICFEVPGKSGEMRVDKGCLLTKGTPVSVK